MTEGAFVMVGASLTKRILNGPSVVADADGAKDSPPNPQVGIMLLVSGYSVGSTDTGFPIIVAVGRSVGSKLSVAVGNPDGVSVSVGVGVEEGCKYGAMLLDGRNDGTEEPDGCQAIDGVSLGLTDGPIEGTKVEDGATDCTISRTCPPLSTLGALSSFTSAALEFLYRSNPPQTAVNPIAVKAATALHPPMTAALVLRRRMASGVEARIMFSLFGCVDCVWWMRESELSLVAEDSCYYLVFCSPMS